MSWDPSVGVLTVGERSVTLTCAAGDNECILRTYLHLVADQREVPLTRSVVLRRDDVLVLAELLDLDDVRLEHKLATILRLSDPEAKALRRDLLRQRVTVAALGVGLVAGLPLTGVVSAAGAEAPSTGSPAVEVASAEKHDVVVLAASPTTVAVTVEVPAPAPEPTLPAGPPMAAASAPTPSQPAADIPPVVETDPGADIEIPPAPPSETDIGYSVTYERDPEFEAPEGVEIGDAMVIERDVPPPPPA